MTRIRMVRGCRRCYRVLWSTAVDREQIDGSVTFDTDDYIVEARWRKASTSRGDADIFAAKVLFPSADEALADALDLSIRNALLARDWPERDNAPALVFPQVRAFRWLGAARRAGSQTMGAGSS